MWSHMATAKDYATIGNIFQTFLPLTMRGGLGPPSNTMFSGSNYPEKDFNAFSRFCRAQAHYKQTDRQTDRLHYWNIGHKLTMILGPVELKEFVG